MNYHDIAEQATRDHMKEYLEITGRPVKYHFSCVSEEMAALGLIEPEDAHPDMNPSMNYNPHDSRVHCHQCGLTLDLMDLIGVDNEITDNRQKLEKAREYFPDIPELTETTGTNGNTAGTKQATPEPVEEQDGRTPEQLKADIELFKAGADHGADLDGIEAWQDRGITYETIERFKLGYLTGYPHFRRSGNYPGYTVNTLTIPRLETPGAGVLRNTAQGLDKKDRYDTRGPKRLYNPKGLYSKDDHVFICEGEIDGLSIYEAGQPNFTALGSTANVEQLTRLLRQPAIDNKIFIILTDNDTAGRTCANKIQKAIADTRKGLYAYIPNGFYPEGIKDPNEYLTTDREAFKKKLSDTLDEARTARDKDRRERARAYQMDASALGLIDDFKRSLGLEDTTPIYPTGYTYLDDLFFSGGLHAQSLIILGALSSAGKTTFIQQIADNIAESGKDVLFFSLEMSTTELMAKSISRLTYRIATETGQDTKTAKTTLGIMDGGRYDFYTQPEIDLINAAVERYKKEIAPNMYIFEGLGNVTVIQAPGQEAGQSIRERVENHVFLTGKRPLVIVDYIQILAPYNDRATDKQNIDKNVLELKRIARDFNIPVIAISSMNRDSYNAPITLSSYKESGALEYSSDILLGLQFEGQSQRIKQGKKTVYKQVDIDAAKQADPRRMELRLLKNRNGSMMDNTIYFSYYPKFNYFDETGTTIDEEILTDGPEDKETPEAGEAAELMAMLYD